MQNGKKVTYNLILGFTGEAVTLLLGIIIPRLVLTSYGSEINGLIVDMTPKAIADGIERLLQDKALYGKIADTLKNEHIGNEEEIEKFYQLVEG